MGEFGSCCYTICDHWKLTWFSGKTVEFHGIGQHCVPDTRYMKPQPTMVHLKEKVKEKMGKHLEKISDEFLCSSILL